MPIIQDPGAQLRLQAAYKLLGFPPAPTLSPEIYPVTLVDDLSAGAGIGGGGGAGPSPGSTIPPVDPGSVLHARLYEKDTITTTPGAGVYATITFVNPAGSGKLALISHLSGTANTDLSVIPVCFASSILVPTAADLGWLKDFREVPPPAGPQQTSACGVFAATSGVAPGGPERSPIKITTGSANTPGESRFLGYVFRPNSGITFKASLSQQLIRLNFTWLERQLLDNEPDGT